MSDKADKKAKKGAKKGAKNDAESEALVSISAHPRAKAGIRRARTRAAFLAFMLVLVLNLAGDQDAFDAVWRALLAGIVVNVIVWRCAIVVWRYIVLHELRQVEESRIERARAHRERMEKLAGEQADGSRVA